MILLGNTFPLSLVRRRVVIEPASLEALGARVQSEGFLSYWGHANTLEAAKSLLGFDPTPVAERPALTLNADLLPTLNDHTFTEAWVLSPNYTPGFRPQMNQAVSPEAITGWEVLRVSF